MVRSSSVTPSAVQEDHHGDLDMDEIGIVAVVESGLKVPDGISPSHMIDFGERMRLTSGSSVFDDFMIDWAVLQ
jgi:hypothetical protein